MKKKEVWVREHTWLDMSTSWFVMYDGIKMGGEFFNQNAAIQNAKKLATKLGAKYTGYTTTSLEIFKNLS